MGLDGMCDDLKALTLAPYYTGLRTEMSFFLKGQPTLRVYRKCAEQAQNALKALLQKYIVWQQVDFERFVCVRVFVCVCVCVRA